MQMISKAILLLVALFLLVPIVGCTGQKTLTVSEVVRDAEGLDGETIRVRGQAFLWTEPSQAEMWMFGGCVPGTDPSHSRQGIVVGWLTLYESIDSDDLGRYGVPHDEMGIRISDSDFHCNGDYCAVTCQPFEVVPRRMYELIGTLKVNADSEIILENIDLERSSQLVEGNWARIPGGEFGIAFP